MGRFKVKRIFLWSALLAILIAVFFISRGPYVSNQLKRVVLPELSAATGRSVFAKKIVLNLFPFFLEVRDLRISEGDRDILRVPKVKGYIEASGLMRGEVVVKKLIVHNPYVDSNTPQMEDMIQQVKAYLQVDRRSLIKVSIRSIAIKDGIFTFVHGGASLRGKGLAGEAVLGTSGIPISKLTVSLKDLTTVMSGWPELRTALKGSLVMRRDMLEVKGIEVDFLGSTIHASGDYTFGDSTRNGMPPSSERVGNLQLRLNLFVESLKKTFGLKDRGEGEVHAKGKLRFSEDIRNPDMDIEVNGGFYIQTLMELLNVRERIEGPVEFEGTLKGPLRGLKGNVKARMKEGNILGIALDGLTCTVLYNSDGWLKFTEGKASLSHGHANTDFSLRVQGPRSYDLHASFFEVDSPAAFKLIGWDPGIPNGKVKGEVNSSGSLFNPSGWFDYEGQGRGADVLGRVKRAKGSFTLTDGLLSLMNTEVRTDRSVLAINGDIDFKSSGFSLTMMLKTDALPDITLPFIDGFSGSGHFSGTVTGSLDDPFISGMATFRRVYFKDYYLGDVVGEIGYRKSLLEVKRLHAGAAGGQGTYEVRGSGPASDVLSISSPLTAVVTGSVRFPSAKKLLDLKDAVFALTASASHVDLGKAIHLFDKGGKIPSLQGRLNGNVEITGRATKPVFKGSLQLQNLVAEGVEIDTSMFDFSYDSSGISFSKATLKRHTAIVYAEGGISHEGRFRFKASGEKIMLSDILAAAGAPDDERRRLHGDAEINMRAEGTGSFEHHLLTLEGTLRRGRIKDIETGSGRFLVIVRDDDATVEASLFDEKVKLQGKAHLKGNIPWSARLEIGSGRYDFIIGALLKELPDDFLFSMKGSLDMSGERDSFSATALIHQLNFSMFGYGFSNATAIRGEIRERRISFSPFTIRSGNTSFTIGGSIDIAREYDLLIEGKTSLTLLKALSKRIDTIRGDAAFVFTLTGKWESPKINGGLEIIEGMLFLKDIPYRLGSVNGYLYMDEDRFLIQALNGRIGGGEVQLTGIVNLQRFLIKKFYIDSIVKNIDIGISRDLTANVSGPLSYTGNLDSQMLTGDLRINRARYTENIDWKSWLLKAGKKEMPKGGTGTFAKSRVNVRVTGYENILIDNNIVKASLQADLVIRGTISNPVVLGRIDMERGSVYFRNNEFKILNASADFSDPKRFNPVMNIVAETTIKGYDIRMRLEGQLDHFDLSLSSTPSLEETEILSLLTVGSFGKETKGIQGGIGVGTATSFLTGQLQDITQERLKSITGLDRIGVESQPSKVTGKNEQWISVTKQLIEDKLSVTYARTFGSVAGEIIKIEYDVGKDVSLIGVREETGAFSGAVKFRFGFK